MLSMPIWYVEYVYPCLSGMLSMSIHASCSMCIHAYRLGAPALIRMLIDWQLHGVPCLPLCIRPLPSPLIQRGRQRTKRGATSSLGRLQVWGHSKCETISSVCVGGATPSLHVLYHKDTGCVVLCSQRHRTCCITKTQDVLHHKDTRRLVVCCSEFQSVVVCCSVLQSVAKCCRLLQNIAMIHHMHLHTHTHTHTHQGEMSRHT